ncbi:hypothetical protein BGZ65_008400, partial [Modicella reniformis]
CREEEDLLPDSESPVATIHDQVCDLLTTLEVAKLSRRSPTLAEASETSPPPTIHQPQQHSGSRRRRRRRRKKQRRSSTKDTRRKKAKARRKRSA